MHANSIVLQQFQSLICSKYVIGDEDLSELLKSNATIDVATRIVNAYYDSLFNVKAGYRRGSGRDLEVESEVDSFVRNIWGASLRKVSAGPVAYLSHDIDYLWPTIQLRLKGVIAERRFSFSSRRESYITSIEQLLDIDRSFIGNEQGGTLFLFSKVAPLGLAKKIQSWLIDPSYDLVSVEFAELLEVCAHKGAHLGIHGSFFAWIGDHAFSQEVSQLSRRTGTLIQSHRAHWLNINSMMDFKTMHGAGVRIDSSMGFNGNLGFRGGMARPHSIVLDQNKSILEVPLLVMDGPLFISRGTRNDHAIDEIKRKLIVVAEEGGAIAMDWHDRSASKEYGWHELYIELLEFCRTLGFRFSSFEELERAAK